MTKFLLIILTEYITEFASKHDVNRIFQLDGTYLCTGTCISEETILLYEAVIGRTYEITTSDIRTKAKSWELTV